MRFAAGSWMTPTFGPNSMAARSSGSDTIQGSGGLGCSTDINTPATASMDAVHQGRRVSKSTSGYCLVGTSTRVADRLFR